MILKLALHGKDIKPIYYFEDKRYNEYRIIIRQTLKCVLIELIF